jgi:hypothetical protein
MRNLLGWLDCLLKNRRAMLAVATPHPSDLRRMPAGIRSTAIGFPLTPADARRRPLGSTGGGGSQAILTIDPAART